MSKKQPSDAGTPIDPSADASAAPAAGTVIDSSKVSGPKAKVPKRASDKQIAANQANAKKSTGPTTEAGKARSSRNAETHGAYARQLHPLGSGPFSEEPSEFYEHASKLIGGFEPEDELIAELAKRAADALMKMRRLDDFEAAMSFVTAIPDDTVKTSCGDLHAAELVESDMERLKLIAMADMPGMTADAELLEEMDWESVAKLVRRLLTTKCSIPGLWDADHEPATDEEWERAARKILDAALPDPQHRWLWANGLHANAYAHRRVIEQETKALIASKLITGPLASIERPRNHLWREFNQAITQIQRIRKMREA